MKFLKEHKTLTWSIVGFVLIVVAIIYVNVSTYQDKRNIFDEIYYVEKDMYPQTNTVLNGIEGISTHSYVDSGEDFKDVVNESYNKNSIPKGYNYVGFSFYLKNTESFVFSYQKWVNAETQIAIFKKYFVKKKKLTQSLVFIKGEKWIDDSKQIAELRKQYNITDQMLEQYNKEILNNFFLRDWCKVYNSNYTPNDWGEVKVEKGWG